LCSMAHADYVHGDEMPATMAGALTSRLRERSKQMQNTKETKPRERKEVDRRMKVPKQKHESYKERLSNFYRKYEPSKVPRVDRLLKKFNGREGQMFKALTKKYGPEPVPKLPQKDAFLFFVS
jgi:hypothetical protein